MLDHLHKVTSKAQKAFNENMATQEEKWYTKHFPNLAGALLGDDVLTDQQLLLVGMKEAKERAEGKGPLSGSDQKNIVDASSQMADQTLDGDKFNVMMADEHKMGVMMNTVAYIMEILNSGKLKPEDEKITKDNLQRLLDHIEASAQKTIALSTRHPGTKPQKYMVELAKDDVFEKEATLAPKIELLKSLIAQQEAELALMRSKIVPVMTDTPVGPVNLGITEGEMEADAFEKIFKQNQIKLKGLEMEYKFGSKTMHPFLDYTDINTAFSHIDKKKLNLSAELKAKSKLDQLNIMKAERTNTQALNLDGGSNPNYLLDNSKKTAIKNDTAAQISIWTSPDKLSSSSGYSNAITK